VIRYELVQEAGKTKAAPDQRVTARLTDPAWGGDRPSIEEARELFDVVRPTDPAEPFATTELALEDVVEPTAADELPKACIR